MSAADPEKAYRDWFNEQPHPLLVSSYSAWLEAWNQGQEAQREADALLCETSAYGFTGRRLAAAIRGQRT